MRRREFIVGLGGAAAWTLAARAQLPRMRRVGVMTQFGENDPQMPVRIAALVQGLQKLGWTEGRNLQIDIRYGAYDPEYFRDAAAKLVRSAPDAIVAHGAATTRAVQQLTKTIPIVFVNVGDPVSNGMVASTARPEGNTTGFTSLFVSIAGKGVELLKEVAPGVVRVAVVFDPKVAFSDNYITSIEAAAATLAVKAIRTPVRNAAEIQHAIDAFAAEPNSGLIVLPPPFVWADRQLMNRLAISHRLPAVYFTRQSAVEGSLMSYGADDVEFFRGASTYVDRILRGAKPGELPVEFPTRFELVVNLKTARAMGIAIPESFLLRADEVIE